MNITQAFWSPTLLELSLIRNNIGVEQTPKIILISSNENTYDAPDEDNPQWKKINKIFFGVCEWFLNDNTKRYHISIRLYDLYNCFYTSASCHYLKRLLPLLPVKAQEEIIRQNFINVPRMITDYWNRRRYIDDIFTLFTETFFSYAPSFQEISPNDIRIYLNFYFKIKHLNKCFTNQVCSFVEAHTDINSVNDRRTLAKAIFSGALFNFPSTCNKETFISYCGARNIDDFLSPERAFDLYEEWQPFLKIREEVFVKFLPHIKDIVDQQYPATHFPSEISQMVTDYAFNLETFLAESAPNDLDSFVSECMLRLEGDNS